VRCETRGPGRRMPWRACSTSHAFLWHLTRRGKNGDNGLRAQTLELDADRWCQKHTGVVGSCYSFYEDCEFAKKRTGTVCPYTITQMANDCELGVGHPCFVSRTECLSCDDLCEYGPRFHDGSPLTAAAVPVTARSVGKEKYTKYVGENLEPASTVSYLMLVFCVLASVVMTYLISAVGTLLPRNQRALLFARCGSESI
jgi:hypothetical protein